MNSLKFLAKFCEHVCVWVCMCLCDREYVCGADGRWSISFWNKVPWSMADHRCSVSDATQEEVKDHSLHVERESEGHSLGTP